MTCAWKGRFPLCVWFWFAANVERDRRSRADKRATNAAEVYPAILSVLDVGCFGEGVSDAVGEPESAGWVLVIVVSRFRSSRSTPLFLLMLWGYRLVLR